MEQDKIIVVNPTTQARVSELSVHSAEHVNYLAEKARAAQLQWSRVSVPERLAGVRRTTRRDTRTGADPAADK